MPDPGSSGRGGLPTVPASSGLVLQTDTTVPGGLAFASPGAVPSVGLVGDIVAEATGSTALAGATGRYADAGHRHPMPAASTATPLIESGAGAAGTSILASRDDHVHPAASGGTVIAGAVNSDGTIARGTGFSVVRNGSGDYTITWTAPFATPPVVIASLAEFAAGRPSIAARNPGGGAASTTAVQILIGVVGVSLSDSAFQFLAHGL